jgi:hypothetical protein
VRVSTAICLVALLVGCAGEPPSGLRATPAGTGPMVVWDLDAEPLPEIPFPNDLATRADSSSPTGRRLDIPLRGAATRHERLTRQRVNRLEGFSTYGAITVAFDETLDLESIIKRHGDADPKNDAVLLINVDPRSKRYGQRVPLDLGQGGFPEPPARTNQYWARDPRWKVESLVFDTTDEDKNKNGKLDPGEDTDGDGHLDVPNVHPVGGDPLDDMVNFYERVTRTLIARPLIPLDQETRYAVVLTRHLKGEDGQPVRSPWEHVNHGRQTAALEPLKELLPLSDIAFAWSFTTLGPTRDLEALRAGLYGHGPLARLAEEFPPELTLVQARAEGQNLYILPAATIAEPLAAFGSMIDAGVLVITDDSKNAVLDSLNYVDYFVAGTVTGPNLLFDRDGDGSEQDEVWELDRKSGAADYASHEVPFLCAIPRANRGNYEGASKPPFPVAIYAHGYGSCSLELLAFAGNIARYGVATCGIDAVGHGLNAGELHGLLKIGLTAFNMGPLFDHVYPSRARDVDNDTLYDSGAGFVSANLFNTRDNIRQTVLDIMVLVRALRALDGSSRTLDLDGDGQPELAGDFDTDGKVDIAGPKAPYYAWGTSLGAIITSVVAGIEPAVAAASPQAGGGGLVDIARRSSQEPVRHAVVQRLLGPIFIGQPTDGPGEVAVSTLATTGNSDKQLELARLSGVAQGDRVEVENLENGERRAIYVEADGGFRTQIPADAASGAERRAAFNLEPTDPNFKPARVGHTRALGDRLVLRHYKGQSATPKQVVDRFTGDVTFEGVTYTKGSPLVALSWGHGLPRNSPDLRRLVTMAQIIIDPADPINYAPHYRRDPLVFDYDSATPGANVLLIATAGDTTVPVSSAVALARAAGAVSLEQTDPRFGKTPNQVVIDSYIVEGLSRLRRHAGEEILVDPEDFSRGRHAPRAPRLVAPLRLQREIGSGLVALRIPLLNPKGQHAFLLPSPKAEFDNNTFMVHMVGRFLQSGGKALEDDGCMASARCGWIPAPLPNRIK